MKILLFLFLLINDAAGGDYFLQANLQHKILTSPNYPLNYPDYSSNSYKITSFDTDFGVVIEFHDLSLDETHGCNYHDYIKIYEGSIITGRLLSTICGTNSPDPLYSQSNVVSIEFVSDHGLTSRGFSLRYYARENPPMTPYTPADTSELDVGEIIGIVIGVILLVIIIICIIVVCCTSSSKKTGIVIQQPNVTIVTGTQSQGQPVAMVTQGQGPPPPPYSEVDSSGIPPPFVYYPPTAKSEPGQTWNTKY